MWGQGTLTPYRRKAGTRFGRLPSHPGPGSPQPPASRPPGWSGSRCAWAPGEQAPASSCCRHSHLGMNGAPLAAQTGPGGALCPKGTGLGASLSCSRRGQAPSQPVQGEEPIVCPDSPGTALGPALLRVHLGQATQRTEWDAQEQRDLSRARSWCPAVPPCSPGGQPALATAHPPPRAWKELQGDRAWPPSLHSCRQPRPRCCGLLCRREVAHASTRLGTRTCSKYLSPAKRQAKGARGRGSPFRAHCGRGPQAGAQDAGEHGGPGGWSHASCAAAGLGARSWVLPPGPSLSWANWGDGGCGEQRVQAAADLGPWVAASGWTALAASALGEPRHLPLPLAVPQPGALHGTSSRSPAGRSLDAAQGRAC